MTKDYKLKKNIKIERNYFIGSFYKNIFFLNFSKNYFFKEKFFKNLFFWNLSKIYFLKINFSNKLFLKGNFSKIYNQGKFLKI